MKINRGDWAVIGEGKVAHYMGQGYNGLAPICTPKIHHVGVEYSADVEQEDLQTQANAKKCKRCLNKLKKWGGVSDSGEAMGK